MSAESPAWAATVAHAPACVSHAALPYPATDAQARGCYGFGVRLIPGNYRRKNARPVSYYALFKWWLLLSQHPGCLRTLTSLLTKANFGTLAGNLGCCPLDEGAYPPSSDCRITTGGIRSWIGFGSPVGPLAHSVLYPHLLSYPTLALRLFRGERDITRLD